MKVKCPGCSAEFAVDDNRIPPQGMQIRCPRCFKLVSVSGGQAPASELEAALGIDLSGPSEKKEAGLSDGWEEMEPLSPSDLSLIGMYEKLAPETEGFKDVVWDESSYVKDKPGVGEKGSAEKKPSGTAGKLDEKSSFSGADVLPPDAQGPKKEPLAAKMAGVESSLPETERKLRGVEGTEEKAFQEEFTSPDFRTADPFGDVIELEPGESLPAEKPADGQPVASEAGQPEVPDSIFAVEERSGKLHPPEFEFGEGEDVTSPGARPPIEGEGQTVEGPPFFEPFERQTLTSKPAVAPKTPEPAALGQPPGGGGPTVDDIDFTSLLDDAPIDKGAESEVFFVDSPSMPQPQFEAPKVTGDSFSMEEISLDDLDSLTEVGASPGPSAEGASSLGEDMFELEIAPEELAPKLPTMPTDTIPVPEVRKEERPSKRPRELRRRKGSLGILGAVVVVLLAAGAAWQFGLLDELFAPRRDEVAAPTVEKVEKKPFPPRLYSEPAEFERALSSLLKELEIHPEFRVETEEEILWVIAWYNLLFHTEMELSPTAGKDSYKTRYAVLKKSHAGEVFKLRLEAMELAATGDFEQGSKKFLEYRHLKERRMAQLLEKGKLTPRLAREDELLNSLFLLETGQLDEAERVLKELMAERKGELYPTLLLARVHAARAQLAAKDPQKARVHRNRAIDRLKEITEQYPQHTGAKLLLARLLGEEQQLDAAIALATECLQTGKTSKNYALQIDSYRALAAFLTAKGDRPGLVALLEELKLNILGKKTGLPEPEDLLLKLCELYLEDGKVEQALGTLELCGEGCSSPRFYLLHATAYQRSNLFHTAIDKAREGHQKYPEDAELLLILAELSRKTDQTNSAVAYLQQILKLKPNNIKAALTLANLFLEIDNPAQARRVLLEAEQYVEDSLELEEKLAEINEAMNDDAGCIAALTKLNLLKPDDQEIRKKLAFYLVKQGNYQEAIKHYEILDQKGLITPDMRSNYARCLKATGKVQDAVDLLKKLLDDDPGDVETAITLAEIYLQKEDHYNARIYLEKARRADTSNAEIHYLLGTTCLSLQDDKCATEAFEQAVKLQPGNLRYVEQYANQLFKLSRTAEGKELQVLLKESRKYFDMVIAQYDGPVPVPKDRRNADVYFNRGRILFDTGHYAEALKDLDMALSLAKHRSDVLVAFADTLFKMNRYDDALKYYQEMIDRKVEPAHAYFHMGLIHLYRDRKEEAKTNFLKCISSDSKGFPDAYRHLGDIFREKGLRKMAIDQYRAWLSLVGPSHLAYEEVKSAIQKLR